MSWINLSEGEHYLCKRDVQFTPGSLLVTFRCNHVWDQVAKIWPSVGEGKKAFIQPTFSLSFIFNWRLYPVRSHSEKINMIICRITEYEKGIATSTP